MVNIYIPISSGNTYLASYKFDKYKNRDWGPVAGLEKVGFGSGPQKTQVYRPGFRF